MKGRDTLQCPRDVRMGKGNSDTFSLSNLFIFSNANWHNFLHFYKSWQEGRRWQRWSHKYIRAWKAHPGSIARGQGDKPSTRRTGLVGAPFPQSHAPESKETLFQISSSLFKTWRIHILICRIFWCQHDAFFTSPRTNSRSGVVCKDGGKIVILQKYTT